MPTFRTSSSGSLSRTCSCSSRSSTSSLSTLPALSALNGSPVPKQPVARPQACNIIFIFLLVALAALSFSLGTTGRARTALLYLNQRYIIHRAPFYLTATLSRCDSSLYSPCAVFMCAVLVLCSAMVSLYLSDTHCVGSSSQYIRMRRHKNIERSSCIVL